MKLLTLNEPASASVIDRLRTKYPSLPSSYFALLARSNGVEGDLGISWVQLWNADEACLLSDEYGLPTYRPGYFAFGSTGGGELLVCALDGDDKRLLYRLPAIGMSDAELLPLAACFQDLAAEIERAG